MPSFSLTNCKHLLHRTLFGYSKRDLAIASSLGSISEVVNQLLEEKEIPSPPSDWVNLVPAQTQIDNGSAGKWYKDLTNWWNQQMLSEGLCMREKMVLFLHNHFSNERDKVNYPQYMYRQNQLFRKFAFGNFKQLVKEITIDASMLIYLDGNNSRGTSPNENYSRELLELFTMGIGNYSENDIIQAAKALSGYQVKGLDVIFDSTRSYKETSLTIFNKAAAFNVNTLIDHIFEQKATPVFICRKLYREFIYYKPNEEFVARMATVFVKNNFEIKPVLEFMLNSDEFYKTDYQGSKIKNPQELIIGTCKLLELPKPDLNNCYDMAIILQMQLFNPPNVAGWPGQRNWISSTTYSFRGGFTDSLLSGRRYNGATVTGKLDTLPYIRTFVNAEKADLLIEEICDLFLALPVSTTKKMLLQQTLLSGTIVSNWSTYLQMADTRVNALLKTTMRLPEFQLM